MQPLLWLNELQDTHLTEVGRDCLFLSQLHTANYPIQPGFILPSTVLDSFLTTLDWDNTLLQDFPHLNLKFDVEDPIATQEIVNTIQKNILNTPLPKHWQTTWSKALQTFNEPWLMIKPYFWATKTPTNPPGSLAHFGQYCANHPKNFLKTLQQTWAEVFNIQNILLLQAQGIRLNQVQVSLLVQPISCPVASGWLQITSQTAVIQAILGSPKSVWLGEALPEQWICNTTGTILHHQLSEQSFAYWLNAHPNNAASIDENANEHPIAPKQLSSQQRKQPILSSATVQELIGLARSLQAYQKPFANPITLTWILQRLPQRKPLQLLLYHLDAELPLPSPSASHWRSPPPLETAPIAGTNLDTPLLTGIGVSTGQIVAPVVVVQSIQEIQPDRLSQSILVTSTLDTMHLPWLRASAGCICETGSPVSHGAILARELGCPAIMNAQGATRSLTTGQWVLLDGDSGHIYSHSGTVPATLEKSTTSAISQSDKTHTKLLVTMSHANHLEWLATQSVDGIGLIRGEWLLLNSLTDQRFMSGIDNLSPVHWHHCQQLLQKLIHAAAPLPVFYRLIDFGAMSLDHLFLPTDQTDQQGTRQQTLMAARPQCRGIGCHLLDHQLFHAELSMLREILSEGVTNLHLILPFVRSVQEVEFCYQQLAAFDLYAHPHLPIWVMAEVPSVLYLLEQYAQMKIQGIAIGLNDFTQLLLGADRNHNDFWDCVETNQSVVMTAILQLVTHAHDLGLQTMLCSELRQYPPTFLKQLIQSGLDACAVDVSAVEIMRQAIVAAEQL